MGTRFHAWVVASIALGCGQTSNDRAPPDTMLPRVSGGSSGASGSAASSGSTMMGGAGGGSTAANGIGEAGMASSSGAGIGGAVQPSEAGSAGVGGVESPEPCSGVGKLSLSNLQIRDATGDGVFSEGERIRLVASVASSGGPARAKLSVTNTHPRELADSPWLTVSEGSAVESFDVKAGEQHVVSIGYDRIGAACCGSEVGFTLTLSNEGAPECDPSSVTEQTIVLVDTPDSIGACDEVRSLRLSQAQVVDSSGDSHVQPGEDFDIKLILKNEGPTNVSYPVVMVHPDLADITSRDELLDCTAYYGIATTTEEKITCELHAGAMLAPGTKALLQLTSRTVFARCLRVTPFEVPLTIE